MTTVEAATSANHEQATNLAAAEGIPAAAKADAAVAEARAEPAAPLAQAAPDRADVSAAAPVAAPAELAAAVEAPVKPAPKKVAVVADEEEEEAAAEDAPADLALDADVFEAIAAADGARAMPGASGQASLLSNENGGIGIVPILAVVAAGAGAVVLLSGGDDDQPSAPPPPPPPANRAPVFTSGATATVAENAAVTTTVYDANATDADNDTITYALSGTDAALFNINAQTGVVTLKAPADFETKASYDFNVVATDGKGGSTTQAVKVTVTDVVEGPPPAETVNLDTADTDANLNTAQVVDAEDGDVIFTDNVAVGSNSIITGFGEGDVVRIIAPANTTASFTTSEDGKDVEISFNVNGVTSQIVLEDVLEGDEGIIFNEALAEAAVGYDFFEFAAPAVAAADQSFA